MSRKRFVLLAMLAASPARADLVLNQLGGADDYTGDLISDSTNFSVTWTAGFSGEFEKVKFRIYNVSGVSTITSLALAFSLDNSAGVPITGINTYGGGAVNTISDYEFDLSSLNFSFISSESGSLYFHKDAAGSSGGIVNWSTTDRGVDTFFGWSGGATPGLSGNGQFDLSATAVPEPKWYTMMAVGLIGLVLLRRKRLA